MSLIILLRKFNKQKHNVYNAVITYHHASKFGHRYYGSKFGHCIHLPYYGRILSLYINGRTLKHDDTDQNLPWSVSDHLGFWLVIDVSAVQNPFERHFLIKLTVSDYFFPKIIHIKGLKAEKGLLFYHAWLDTT